MDRFSLHRSLVIANLMVAMARVAYGSEPTDVSPNDAACLRLVVAAQQAESEGLNELRTSKLNEALALSPSIPAVHWHRGQVLHEGNWISVKDFQRAAANDPNLVQYRALRERSKNDFHRELELARWCSRHGMEEHSKIHLGQLALGPNTDPKTRVEAAKKLNLQYVGEQLLSADEIAEQRLKAKQWERAVKAWQPKLERWRQSMDRGNGRRVGQVVSEMDQIADPQFILAAELFVQTSGDRFGEQLMATLGRFHQADSTRVLADFAIHSPQNNVREAAIRLLRYRPRHDFVPLLLGQLQAPISSQWSIRPDAIGSFQYQHVWRSGDERQNYVIAQEQVIRARRKIVATEYTNGLVTEFRGFRNVSSGPPEFFAAALVRQASERETQLSRFNSGIHINNEPIFYALEQSTNAPIVRDSTQWWYWWQKENEDVKPRSTQYVNLPSKYASYSVEVVAQYEWHSCFAAGTKVWTDIGQLPIEQIQIGDPSPAV